MINLKALLSVALLLITISHIVDAAGIVADYLLPNERELVIEMNLARTDPRQYADYLIELRQYYDGDLIKVPGETAIQTQEGVAGIDEAIEFLQMVQPVPSLIPSPGMSRAARDHVKDQGPEGLMGHHGTDGSNSGMRLDRYGKWSNTAGENISYGRREARRIVINQIIDDGVRGRGHRINLLNSEFKRVGVGCGEHAHYRYMCVIDLAAGYTER